MSTFRINAAFSRQAGLAHLMDLHRAAWDQVDANGLVAALSGQPPQAVDSGKPLSTPIIKPNYRPFWASRLAPRVGMRRSRADQARINHGGEAEVPLWQGMTSGHARLEPIPGEHRLEVPIMPERVHRSRVAEDARGEDSGAQAMPPDQPMSRRQTQAQRREAELGRARFFARFSFSVTPGALFA